MPLVGMIFMREIREQHRIFYVEIRIYKPILATTTKKNLIFVLSKTEFLFRFW